MRSAWSATSTTTSTPSPPRAGLDAGIDVDAFRHVARYDLARIEMLLRATRPTTLRFPTLDLDVPLAAGEDIRTEISSKFARPRVEGLLAGAGLTLTRWDTRPRRPLRPRPRHAGLSLDMSPRERDRRMLSPGDGSEKTC